MQYWALWAKSKNEKSVEENISRFVRPGKHLIFVSVGIPWSWNMDSMWYDSMLVIAERRYCIFVECIIFSFNEKYLNRALKERNILVKKMKLKNKLLTYYIVTMPTYFQNWISMWIITISYWNGWWRDKLLPSVMVIAKKMFVLCTDNQSILHRREKRNLDQIVSSESNKKIDIK